MSQIKVYGLFFVSQLLVFSACGGREDFGTCATCLPISTSRFEVCNDLIDNDEDGLIDCEDPDCALSQHCRVEICDNGIDDDQDGLTDCEDPNCQNLPICQTSSGGEENCEDGIDNDFDGAVDCDDSDCVNHPSCLVEEVPSILSFQPSAGYRAGYCRNQDDLTWVSGKTCRGTILLFTVYEGTTQFPNYSGTVCNATTLVTGTNVAEIHCEQGTDALVCDPQCFAICGPQRYGDGTSQVSFLCVLDGASTNLLRLSNEIANNVFDDENFFIETFLDEY